MTYRRRRYRNKYVNVRKYVNVVNHKERSLLASLFWFTMLWVALLLLCRLLRLLII